MHTEFNDSTEIIDAILALPQSYTIGETRYYIHKPTLGKLLILSKQLQALKVDARTLSANPFVETIRLASIHRRAVAEIIAYAALNSPSQLTNPDEIKNATQRICDSLNTEDLATLLTIILSDDNTEAIIRQIGIAEDLQRRNTIAKAQQDKSDSITLTFGGHSLYGTILDRAAERYGWTKDYILWGVDFASLRLMLADQISTIYTSKKEAHDAYVEDSILRADDPANLEKIKSMKWN